MRRTTVPSNKYVGTWSSTSVRSGMDTGCRASRNSHRMMGTVARAPSSTAQKMLGRPSMKKKSRKSISA